MTEYDTLEYSSELLEYLRKNTKLGPIALLKVKAAKNEAERLTAAFNKVSHEKVDIDYRAVSELEFQLRLSAYYNHYAPLWMKYGDGLGIIEFGNQILMQNYAKDQQRKMK